MRPYRISAGDCLVLEKIGGVVHIIPICGIGRLPSLSAGFPFLDNARRQPVSYPVPGHDGSRLSQRSHFGRYYGLAAWRASRLFKAAGEHRHEALDVTEQEIPLNSTGD